MTLYQGKRILLAAMVLIGSASHQSQAAFAVPESVKSVASAPIEGAKWVGQNPKLVALSALVALFAHSIYMFNSREPDREPNRYDMSKFTVEFYHSNPKAFWDNVYYMYEDGLIGHSYKSSSLKPDAGGEIEIKGPNTIQNRGLYGWIHSRTKALMPTCWFGVRATIWLVIASFGVEFFIEFTKNIHAGKDPFTALFNALATVKQITSKRLPIGVDFELIDRDNFQGFMKVSVPSATA